MDKVHTAGTGSAGHFRHDSCSLGAGARSAAAAGRAPWPWPVGAQGRPAAGRRDAEAGLWQEAAAAAALRSAAHGLRASQRAVATQLPQPNPGCSQLCWLYKPCHQLRFCGHLQQHNSSLTVTSLKLRPTFPYAFVSVFRGGSTGN